MSYLNKDIAKFSPCNKLITRGVTGSSSDKYRYTNPFGIAQQDINSLNFNSDDIVGVSVNGKRKSRLCFDSELVTKALLAGASIVTDNNYHRNRTFNIGERELAQMLMTYNVSYSENNTMGVWKLKGV